MMPEAGMRRYFLCLALLIRLLSFGLGDAAAMRRVKSLPMDELGHKVVELEGEFGGGERLLRERRGGRLDAHVGRHYWSRGSNQRSIVRGSWASGASCGSGVGSTMCSIRVIRGTVYDVTQYGAVGDGLTDDKAAFLKAFSAACSNTGPAVVLVPEGKTFLVSDFVVHLCNSNEPTWKVDGTVVAPADPATWPTPLPQAWIQFLNVSKLAVVGRGTLNGNGENWWLNTSVPRPKGITFSGCNDLQISQITVKNMARLQVDVRFSVNALIMGIRVLSPFEAPNVVGIQTNTVFRATIRGCYISTGDDDITLQGGSSNIRIADNYIGFGHGISIGSLGRDGAVGCVSDVIVERCLFDKTEYGARIKTWQGGVGAVRNIVYRYLKMIDVAVPINLNQYYCNPQRVPDGNCELADIDGALAIYNVTYSQISGTYSNVSNVATDPLPEFAVARPAFIGCSVYIPCHVTLSNIWLRPSRGTAVAPVVCKNIYGHTDGTLEDCLIAMPFPAPDIAPKANASASVCSYDVSSFYPPQTPPASKCLLPQPASTSSACHDLKANIMLSARLSGPVNAEMDVYTFKFSVWIFNTAVTDVSIYIPLPQASKFYENKDMCKFERDRPFRRNKADGEGFYDVYGPFYHHSTYLSFDNLCTPCVDNGGMTITNFGEILPSSRRAALTVTINLRTYYAPVVEGVLFDSTCGSGSFPKVDTRFQ